MSDKLETIAEKIADMVKRLCRAVQCDKGVFILKKGEGMGMFYEGDKDDAVGFFRRCVEKLQQVIDETEKGNLDLVDPKKDKFIYDKETGQFSPLGEPKEDDNGQKWGAN